MSRRIAIKAQTKVCVTVFAAVCLAQAQVPAYKALKYPPLRDVKIPDVAAFTLTNGIRVYLLEDHELPTIRGFALVRTGNLFDPKDKVGLADLTGGMIRSGGTRSKTGDQIDEQLENIAASVESHIDETNGEVSFSTLTNTTDEVLGVFHDVLTQPEFRQEKIDLAKTQYRSSISRRNDDAAGIAQREFNNIVYGKDTPYGWQIEYATLDRIQRPDIIAFYQRYFFPANVILAVSGDFSAADMHAKLEKLFADWSVKQDPVPPFPKVDKVAHPGTFLAVKTEVTQTNFILGQLGGQLNDPDFAPLEVMGDILGGGFRSRLVRTVRTDLGLAYNIYSYWGANYNHPGLFQIGGSTKSASTTAAIQAALTQLQKMRTAEVTREELETAKQSVLNSFVFNFDTPSKTLQRLVYYDYYGYPKDFIYQYRKAIQAVTQADILRVARERVDPKQFTLVAVGNPKDFGQPLSVLGMPVSDLDITIPEPMGEVSQGRELFKQMQAAAGGSAKIDAIRDMRQTLNMQFAAPSGLKSSQVNYWASSGLFRQENALPFGKVVAYSDGKSGWLRTPQGATTLAGPHLKQVQGEIFRNYISLLQSDRHPDRSIALSGALSAPNTLTISNQDGESVELKIDPATKLIASESYKQVQPTGAPSDVTITLSDYREVDGIKLPFKMTLKQGEQQMAEAVVSEYKLNSGIKPEELSKQP
jgi:zinc protease